ncbi:hypothetical protein [Nocardiopsis quinghaiensis]|uniref:hypothetical protein n=1 Tax=Nocardiopsis quinghaiensis TaxID=464995 RepID=UPI00123C119E|nr:hypothetical protein [Nocardiopsis quinghaiensis]
MGHHWFGGTDVERDALTLGEELGRGGQGTVHRVAGGPHAGLVYKHYTLSGADPRVLERLVMLPHDLTDTERARLFALSCWPLARVVSKGFLTGFLMREIPEEFVGRTRGGGSRLQELQYLIFQSKPMWGDIVPPDVHGRLELVRQYVSLFQLLHSRGLVVGDVSMSNLLWTAGGGYGVFMLDCDGVRRSGDSPVLPQADTDSWDDPEQPPTGADLETDRYKLSLLVGRVLSRHKNVRPGEPLDLLPGLPSAVVDAVTRRFEAAGKGYGTRPDAHQWGVALGGRTEIPVRRPKAAAPVDLPLARLQSSGGADRQWIPVRKPGEEDSPV